MFGGNAVAANDESKRSVIAGELRAALARNEPSEQVANCIWKAAGESQATFFEQSVTAYHCLGVSDEVRDFMGRLWASVLQGWPVPAQQEFLQRIVGEERLHLFEALDFAPPVFRRIPFSPEFMSGWVVVARKAVGNDLFQRGLFGCLENFAWHQPAATLEIIPLMLRDRHDPQVRGAIARLLHEVRRKNKVQEGSLAGALNSVEASLRAPGDAALRSLFLESWAIAAGEAELDEARALALRDLCHGAAEETLAWCFLLARVVDSRREHWPWVHRELVAVSLQPLDAQAKFWVTTAALHGWMQANEGDTISRKAWADLYFALPLTKTDGGAWRQLEHVLVEMLAREPARACEFILRLAAVSGKIWCELLDEERDHLAWFNQMLQRHPQAAALVTSLCLSHEKRARKLGVKLFAACNVEALQPEAIAQANAIQLELLVLQASLMAGEYDDTARLHASIARRIDELGGQLAETFYGEVEIQARNTHQYRERLEKNANGHARLVATVQEAHRSLDATIAAAKSPALMMEIPGRERAERLAMRQFGRKVQQGFSKFSILQHIATTVPLLYGRTWRSQDLAGNLTDASSLQKSEVKMEMPRLEFVNPDAMRYRRLVAGQRIAELQRAEGAPE